MRTFLATTALVLSMSGTAWAQSFPEQPVTIVVPYTAGAVTDVVARYVAANLQEQWGQPVVVENRPGGGSMVGSAYVSQAEPDGYTLLVTTSAYSTAPAILNDMPFDPVEGMQPVGLVGFIPMVFVAGPSTEGETLVEFLEEAGESPKFAATAGLGTTTHFTVEMLMQASGVDMDVVHYGGGGEVVVALMGGHADIYASTPGSTLDHIQSGALRALAIAGPDRTSVLPDVPSTGELGLEGINAAFWVGMLAPAGMPDELLSQINASLNTALEDPTVIEQLSVIDLAPSTTTAEEFEAQIVQELGDWADLAEARGITGD